jgi:hypothetical protein
MMSKEQPPTPPAAPPPTPQFKHGLHEPNQYWSPRLKTIIYRQ